MLSVDRIENSFAVCIDDNGKSYDIPLDKIIGKLQEGDIINLQNGKYIIDKAETDKRRKKIISLQNDLWE